MFAEISRRRLLLGAAVSPWVGLAHASPRAARGGTLSLRVPFALRSFDPHALTDVGSMLFERALFEPLYRMLPARNGEAPSFEPVLAEALPSVTSKGTLSVPLRAGLITGRGRALSPRHFVESIERARRSSGRFVLHGIPTPTVATREVIRESIKVQVSSLEFNSKDEARLLLALSSPLLAVVGPSFAPGSPDGTGPFVADGKAADDSWSLRRNLRAASGVSLLDGMQIRRAASLSDSLRAFEAGDDQLAWHGLGLHDPRPGARAFDAGAVGVLGLAVGREAGSLDVPGVAQQLCDALPPQRFAHLNVGAAWPVSGRAGWTGAPQQLLVADDSAYLREVAETVAVLLANPGHEVSVRAVPQTELAERLRTRGFGLALVCARTLWPTPLGSYASLLALSDPDHAAASLARPAKVQNARSMGRSLRVGMLGELRWQGGVAGELQLPLYAGGLDFGGAHFVRRRK